MTARACSASMSRVANVHVVSVRRRSRIITLLPTVRAACLRPRVTVRAALPARPLKSVEMVRKGVSVCARVAVVSEARYQQLPVANEGERPTVRHCRHTQARHLQGE